MVLDPPLGNSLNTLKSVQVRQNVVSDLNLIRSDVVFIMLINVKMSTIIGILTFICRINFVLRVDHAKNFIINKKNIHSQHFSRGMSVA